MAHNLKQGNVYTYSVPQNTTNYQVRVANTPKGLWICILQSVMQWKLTITQELIQQIIIKASGGKQTLTYKQFINAVVNGLQKNHQKWSIGIMTPVQLEVLRGGSSSKTQNNNKIYMILSDKQNKYHYPFTFVMNDLCEKEKYIQAIKNMKTELQSLRGGGDKSQSFSMMSETHLMEQQLKVQNQELKKKIKLYEESLTQKRGAVEIDSILKEKNNLELQAETKKREQARQINRLKNVFALMQRQNSEIKTEVDVIYRQLTLLQDNISNPAKLKSHALRVLKSYETELRTSKKVVMKQTKEIETVKRNIQNCKNNEKKVLMKIKQIQTELQQAKKKANVKEISNRLYSHSGGSRQASSVGSSSKAPSVVSNSSNGNNNNRSVGRNLVRQNLLKKTSDIRNDRSASNSNSKNNLLKTTPNIKTPAPPRKTEYKPPVRPVVSSHQIAKNNSQTKQGYSNNRNTYQRNDTGPLKSASTEFKKKEYSPAERDRQKQAIDRLTGGNKRTISNNKSNEKTSKERVPLKNNYTQKPGINGKKDNPKDILNRMKQVKAQYNTRSRNSINKNKDVTAKVAELTNKK